MKKTIVTLLLMFIVMSMMVIPSKADSADIVLTPSVQSVGKGETVKVVVATSNVSAGSDACVAFDGVLEFDKNVFEEIDIYDDLKTVIDWRKIRDYNTANGKFALAGEGKTLSNETLFEITFKVKDTASAGNTTITLKDMELGFKNTKLEPTNASTTVNITAGSSGTPTGNDDTTAPVLKVSYADVTGGKQVTITSNEPLQEVAGWTISADRKTLTKTYTANFSGKVAVVDDAGNRAEATINVELGNGGGPVNVIDVTKPTGKVTTAKDSRGVTVTITASEAVQPVSGWTLSADKKVLTKTYTANTTENVVLTDLAGNKSDPIKVTVDTSSATGGTGTPINSGTSSSSNNNGAATSSLPKAGVETYLVTLIAIIAIGGTVTFFKYRGMKY